MHTNTHTQLGNVKNLWNFMKNKSTYDGTDRNMCVTSKVNIHEKFLKQIKLFLQNQIKYDILWHRIFSFRIVTYLTGNVEQNTLFDACGFMWVIIVQI